MKKDTRTIAHYYEKLAKAGVDNALLEQTRQTNLELTEALLRTARPERMMSINSVYAHFARSASSDNPDSEG